MFARNSIIVSARSTSKQHTRKITSISVFLKHAYEHLGCNRGIGLQDFEGFGNGVVALDKLEAGVPILRVPQQNGWEVLSVQVAYGVVGKSPTGEELMKHVSKLDIEPVQKALIVGSQSLAIFLALERSRGGLHVDLMPKDVNLPMLWPEDDLRFTELQCSPLKKQTQSLKQLVRGVHENVLLPTIGDVIGLRDLTYSCALVLSRAMSSTKHKIPFCIVPVLDMFNHATNEHRGNCAHWYDHERREFVVVPNSDIKPGEQLFINYGTHSNRDFLRLYGFCLPDNKDECITLPGSDITCHSTGEIESEHPVEKNMVIEKIQNLLERYSTTLDQDLKIPKKSEAVMVRIGEKQALQECLRILLK